jgi:hypothetical protein
LTGSRSFRASNIARTRLSMQSFNI